MDGSSSKDGSEGGERGSKDGSRKGKRAAKTIPDKPREPKRGLGIARLEKIRVEDEMKEALLRGAHNQPPSNSYVGIHGLGTGIAPNLVPYYHPYAGAALLPHQGFPNLVQGTGMVAPNPLPSYQPYVHASLPYPCLTNFATAQGTGDMSGQLNLPIASSKPPTGTPEAASYENPSNMEPNLSLSQATRAPGHKREEDPNLSVESASNKSKDPPEVDLDLKL
ncbi:hypothetical protein ACP70R_033941 [Stipagrostis hirtigluma subsp. patula]